MAKRKGYSFPKFKFFLLVAVLLTVPLTVHLAQNQTNLSQNAQSCDGFVIKGYPVSNKPGTKTVLIPDLTVPTYTTLSKYTQDQLATIAVNIYYRIHPGWYLGSITGATVDATVIHLNERNGTQGTSSLRVPITADGITQEASAGVPITIVPATQCN